MTPMTLPPARLLFVVAVLAVATLSAACAADGARTQPDRTGSATGGGIRAVNATTAALLPVRADALPDFTLARYDELLGQLRGTPVVVNMWGSWCPPCNDEAPLLRDAHTRFGDRVQFLGIDIEDSVAAARAFMRRFGWSFPSVRDPDFPSSFRPGLGFAAQPNTLFYDASGDLVSTWQGPLTVDRLRDGIDRILGEG
jgi:cytochrome c biogenesis protein CcmG, thiol:disulfide interchange protein DsbE